MSWPDDWPHPDDPPDTYARGDFVTHRLAPELGRGIIEAWDGDTGPGSLILVLWLHPISGGTRSSHHAAANLRLQFVTDRTPPGTPIRRRHNPHDDEVADVVVHRPDTKEPSRG